MYNEFSIFRLNFKGHSLDEVISPLDGQCKFVVTVNADFIVRARESDSRLRAIIDHNYSTLDGFWPWILAKLRCQDKRCDKVSGSDLIYLYSNWCTETGCNLLIIGGAEGIANRAAQNLNARYSSEFCFSWSPPFETYPYSEKFIRQFREVVYEVRPSVVVVCLGSPSQEYLLEDELHFLNDQGVSFCYGAGGTVDFVAGSIKRAPKLIQNVGLEGVWRFAAQPSLFRFKRLINSLRIFKYLII